MAIPMVASATVFNAAAATETVDLSNPLSQLYVARSIHLEINGGSTPNWALDIQGRVSPSATWHNIDYFRTDQGAAVTPSVAQLTVNWSTAQHYVIPSPPPFVRLVGTRTGGTLTVYASFSSEAYSVPFSTVNLEANSGVDIGDVDVLSVIPGTGATNLGKAEGAAIASGDAGVGVWGGVTTANDGQGAWTGVDLGDYGPIAVDANGRVILKSHLAHDGAIGSNGVTPNLVGGRASTATPTAVSADGDAVWAWMTREGALMTSPNTQGTAIPQTADSIADVTGSDITNFNSRSLRLVITFADKQGTVTFTPKVQGKTSGGTYYDIWTAAAAVSANSTVVYDLAPFAVSTSSGITESKIAVIPRVFRVVLTYSGAGAGNSFDILGEYDLVV